MISKKGLPFLLVLVFSIVFFAFKYNSSATPADERQQQLLMAIGNILEQKHYDPQIINDDFSKKVFNEYIDNTDPEKIILLKQDIDDLKIYETKIDDEIHGAPLTFYPAVGELYFKRVDEIISIYRDILSRPFDFSVNEKVQMNPDKMDYPANNEERITRWNNKLKYATLTRFVDLQEQRNKANSKDTMATKTDAQLEKMARERVLSSLDRFYSRIKTKLTPEEQFNSFVNTITMIMDPHTEYFPPVEKRAFDEELTGRFYGIGAQLKQQDGQTMVVSLVTGSPAWKSKEVDVNDIITKVGQGDKEPVDVTGYELEDVVKLIRGNKGAVVKITFKKADGTTKVVSLIRDEIVQDEIFARSTVINEGNKKIGYIFLPEFYADYQRPDGNKCSEDVAAEVVKLKAEHVDGIIIDLRNNGGGSLYEVVRMVGLFIPSGPVVQVRDRDGQAQSLNDDDHSVLYDGPLAVMVNELSASASEIFAAAIQDYKRGIIIGSTSTFGKGTVQKTLPLGRPTDFKTDATEYGALKLTFEKFYRVNGGSTQIKGVSSDVVIPDTYEYLKLREKDNPDALKWDNVPPAQYGIVMNPDAFSKIVRDANDLVEKDSAFNVIKKNTLLLSKLSDAETNLGLKAYKETQSTIKELVKADDSMGRLKAPMDMQFMQVDNNKYYNNPDSSKALRYQEWLKFMRSDRYINTAVKVLELAAMNKNNRVDVLQF
ncbi:MAG: carboxy terminal-processing peptidase [Bacteroidetes bacterium]|nr:carboxy terminal-processing peptidase [Bacteroidota bacterium]